MQYENRDFGNTINLVMQHITNSYNSDDNIFLFHELCQRIWVIRNEWPVSHKVESIARLITRNVLTVKENGIIVYNDGTDGYFAIWKDGTKISYDELHNMKLI